MLSYYYILLLTEPLLNYECYISESNSWYMKPFSSFCHYMSDMTWEQPPHGYYHCIEMKQRDVAQEFFMLDKYLQFLSACSPYPSLEPCRRSNQSRKSGLARKRAVTARDMSPLS